MVYSTLIPRPIRLNNNARSLVLIVSIGVVTTGKKAENKISAFYPAFSRTILKVTYVGFLVRKKYRNHKKYSSVYYTM